MAKNNFNDNQASLFGNSSEFELNRREASHGRNKSAVNKEAADTYSKSDVMTEQVHDYIKKYGVVNYMKYHLQTPPEG